MLDALGKLRNLGGFTVTIPHKSAILPLLGRLTRRAQASGSVNLVRRDRDGVLSGDIADGVGFVRGLEAEGHPVEGASVWLIGLGGAGGANRGALCEAGVGRLLVTELDDARADAGLARLSRFYPDVPVTTVSAPNPPKGIHYAINATPLGLKPGDSAVVRPDDARSRRAGRRGDHEPRGDAAAAARPHAWTARPSWPATCSTIRSRSISTGSASTPRASTSSPW